METITNTDEHGVATTDLVVHGTTFTLQTKTSPAGGVRYVGEPDGIAQLALIRFDVHGEYARWLAQINVDATSAIMSRYGTTPEAAIANLAPELTACIEALGCVALRLGEWTREAA